MNSKIAQKNDALNRLSSNRRLFFSLVSLWLGLNAILWFGPAVCEDSCQALSDWRREQDAACYETHLVDGNETNTAKVPYLFFRPDVAKTGNAPLVIVLHGSGERGNDCRAQLATVGTFLVESPFQASHPCFVIAPQCPENENWQSSEDAAVRESVDQLITQMVESEAIDESRIYLIGYSMGAYGCWHYLATMPERFAGCIAVAGGGNPATAAAITGTPVWAIHGDDDTVVTPSQSQQMVDAVNAAGGNARLTMLRNVGHGSFQAVKQSPNEYLDWLFTQQQHLVTMLQEHN